MRIRFIQILLIHTESLSHQNIRKNAASVDKTIEAALILFGCDWFFLKRGLLSVAIVVRENQKALDSDTLAFEFSSHAKNAWSPFW